MTLPKINIIWGIFAAIAGCTTEFQSEEFGASKSAIEAASVQLIDPAWDMYPGVGQCNYEGLAGKFMCSCSLVKLPSSGKIAVLSAEHCVKSESKLTEATAATFFKPGTGGREVTSLKLGGSYLTLAGKGGRNDIALHQILEGSLPTWLKPYEIAQGTLIPGAQLTTVGFGGMSCRNGATNPGVGIKRAGIWPWGGQRDTDGTPWSYDISACPGDSGGPTFDSQQRIVFVTSQQFTRQYGSRFAEPSLYLAAMEQSAAPWSSPPVNEWGLCQYGIRSDGSRILDSVAGQNEVGAGGARYTCGADGVWHKNHCWWGADDRGQPILDSEMGTNVIGAGGNRYTCGEDAKWHANVCWWGAYENGQPIRDSYAGMNVVGSGGVYYTCDSDGKWKQNYCPDGFNVYGTAIRESKPRDATIGTGAQSYVCCENHTWQRSCN